MWNKVRKHSQRLVLVIDAPNGGSWVKQLRGLNRMDQLDLSMCIQASYSTQDNLHIPVNHVPGPHLDALGNNSDMNFFVGGEELDHFSLP